MPEKKVKAKIINPDGIVTFETDRPEKLCYEIDRMITESRGHFT
jgi:hypothetical protein